MPADFGISILLAYIANKTIYEVSKDEIVRLFTKISKESIEQKIDHLLREPFQSGNDHLENSLHYSSHTEEFNTHIQKARDNFIRARNTSNDKERVIATIYVAMCFYLEGKPDLGKLWINKSYEATLDAEKYLIKLLVDSRVNKFHTATTNPTVLLARHVKTPVLKSFIRQISKPPLVGSITGAADLKNRSDIGSKLQEVHILFEEMADVFIAESILSITSADMVRNANPIVRKLIYEGYTLSESDVDILIDGRNGDNFYKGTIPTIAPVVY